MIAYSGAHHREHCLAVNEAPPTGHQTHTKCAKRVQLKSHTLNKRLPGIPRTFDRTQCGQRDNGTHSEHTSISIPFIYMSIVCVCHVCVASHLRLTRTYARTLTLTQTSARNFHHRRWISVRVKCLIFTRSDNRLFTLPSHRPGSPR